MFEAEARWLGQQLMAIEDRELSPLLNVGSSTARFREVVQPWIDAHVFAPLRRRNVEVVHLDIRRDEGVDISADILQDDDLARLQQRQWKAILCCNLLEHVQDPRRMAERCLALLAPGGLLIATVPYSYPYHRDPIDTMFRPTVSQLVEIFPGTSLVSGQIIGVATSYADTVAQRPWILLRHVARFPFPMLGFAKWRRSMAKLYWLFNEYKVTCVVLRKS